MLFRKFKGKASNGIGLRWRIVNIEGKQYYTITWDDLEEFLDKVEFVGYDLEFSKEVIRDMEKAVPLEIIPYMTNKTGTQLNYITRNIKGNRIEITFKNKLGKEMRYNIMGFEEEKDCKEFKNVMEKLIRAR